MEINRINNTTYPKVATFNQLQLPQKPKNASDNLSFKALGEGAIAQKLAKSKGFKNLLLYSNKNTLVIEALYALLITCLLRPAVTLMTPASSEADKEKNKFRAAHAAASGALGFAFTVCFAHPISDAVDKIMNTKLPDGSLKYLKKHADQLLVKDGKVFKELAKRVHQPVFMPLRAMATVALVPFILNAFGIKKNKSDAKPPVKDINNTNNSNSLNIYSDKLSSIVRVNSEKGGN